MSAPAMPPAEMVIEAYRLGVFPMAEGRDSDEVVWVDPAVRGILPLDGLRLSRRLRRTMRARPFEVAVDTDFAGVIAGCAEPAPGREETWICPPIRDVFLELHHRGLAHSVECRRDGELVGGLYGLALGGAFFGESMFGRVRDASKVALAHLVDRLRAGGFTLLDTQFVSPHLVSLGVRAVPKARFHELLARALGAEGDFHRLGPPGAVADDAYPPLGDPSSRQSSTQRSTSGCSSAERLGLEANIQPRKISGESAEPPTSRMERKAALSGVSSGGGS